MKIVKTCCLIFFTGALTGQGGYFQTDEIQKIQLDNIEIQNSNLFSNHLQIKPLNKERCMEKLSVLLADNSLPDTTHAIQLIKDHVEVLHMQMLDSNLTYLKTTKPFLKYFYTDGTHFLSAYKKNFQISLDPLLHVEVGTEHSKLLFINRRGVRIQGSVDQRFYFHSDIIETQLSTPAYVHEYIDQYQSFPGAGLYKIYTSKFLKSDRAYDFLLSEAAVEFKASKHINVSLGHGRHFIGSGIRSLLISDFATPQFYLKFNTNVWRLHYQNLFTELSPESLGDQGSRLLNKKYMAAHYLSINLTKNWNVGIFESVVFARKNGFELQYLNPVILFRFIEHALGSPDNVLLGFHSNIILRKKFSFYAQMLFDEFLLKEFFKSDGWWGNKYGFQVGCKYANAFGVDNLMLQVEYNQIRPYTYTFRDSISNFTHYNQALAHPLGANFKELIFKLYYQPTDRWSFSSQWIHFNKGLDRIGVNNGGNILLDYDTRLSDYGHKTTQGISNKVLSGSVNVSYRLFYRTWVDANFNFRNSIKEEEQQKSTVWMSLGVRMNLDKIRFDF